MESIKKQLKSNVRSRVIGQLRRSLPSVAPDLQRSALYWPHQRGKQGYTRAVKSDAESLPVPPVEFWADYGTSEEGFLASGREDSEVMRKLLASSGFPIENAGRVLDLGVAGGRMIRHLADLTPHVQVWGCDVWSDAVMWCQENLTPPFWFATNTVVPHLPFADTSFGLVYCGSVFTHIDDLAEAWFLELHRIIRPGGRLLFSINDRNAVKIFDGNGDPNAYPRYWERTGGRHVWEAFTASINVDPDYRRFRDGDAWMVSMGRDSMTHAMWDADVLCQRLRYGWECCSMNPASYGHQTLVLLERM